MSHVSEAVRVCVVWESEGCKFVGWICVAQDRTQQRTAVSVQTLMCTSHALVIHPKARNISEERRPKLRRNTSLIPLSLIMRSAPERQQAVEEHFVRWCCIMHTFPDFLCWLCVTAPCYLRQYVIWQSIQHLKINSDRFQSTWPVRYYSHCSHSVDEKL